MDESAGQDTAARADADRLSERLAVFLRHAYGADVEPRQVRRLDGHSGLTYGFDAWRAGKDELFDRLVIRLAPRAGRGRGNMDMVRQARLLQAAARAGVPVPAVRWFGDDPAWFGVSYHVTSLVDGRPFQDWNPDPSFSRSYEAVLGIYQQAIDALTLIQAIPVERLPIAEDPPRHAADEVAHWAAIMERAAACPWRDSVDLVRQGLIADAPPNGSTVPVHGDFRGGNLIYDNDELKAIVNWEIASAGSPLLDLGWLLFFLDTARWYGSGPAHADMITRALIDRYVESTGVSADALYWYAAMARFRYIAIILFNHMLHITGKRPDPLWDRMFSCIPALVDQSQELLTSGRLGAGNWRDQ